MMRRGRIIAVALLALTLATAGCTATTGNTPAPSVSAGEEDPNDVPKDTTDYSVDAGNEQKEYEYEAEEPAADSVVATLCNLNQKYFTGLRTVKSGEPVVDDTLRTSLVGLGDLTDYWDTLRSQYPKSEADIDTGIAIYETWDSALLSQDNGNSGEAKAAMAKGETLIKKLPKTAASGCTS